MSNTNNDNIVHDSETGLRNGIAPFVFVNEGNGSAEINNNNNGNRQDEATITSISVSSNNEMLMAEDAHQNQTRYVIMNDAAKVEPNNINNSSRPLSPNSLRRLHGSTASSSIPQHNQTKMTMTTNPLSPSTSHTSTTAYRTNQNNGNNNNNNNSPNVWFPTLNHNFIAGSGQQLIIPTNNNLSNGNTNNNNLEENGSVDDGIDVLGSQPSPKNFMEWSRQKSGPWVTSRRFKRTTLILIWVNTILLGMRTSLNAQADDYHNYCALLDGMVRIFLLAFTFESLLLLAHYQLRVFVTGWMLVDLLVVVCAWWISPTVTVLRAFRIIRSLRKASSIPQLKSVITAFLRMIPQMILGVALLWGMVLFMFAVLFTGLFQEWSISYYTNEEYGQGGEDKEEYFTRLDRSALTLFQIVTHGRLWSNVTDKLMDDYPAAWVPMVLFVTISVLLLSSFLVAVATESVHVSIQQLRDNDAIWRSSPTGSWNHPQQPNNNNMNTPQRSGAQQQQPGFFYSPMDDNVDDDDDLDFFTDPLVPSPVRQVQVQHPPAAATPQPSGKSTWGPFLAPFSQQQKVVENNNYMPPQQQEGTTVPQTSSSLSPPHNNNNNNGTAATAADIQRLEQQLAQVTKSVEMLVQLQRDLHNSMRALQQQQQQESAAGGKPLGKTNKSLSQKSADDLSSVKSAPPVPKPSGTKLGKKHASLEI